MRRRKQGGGGAGVREAGVGAGGAAGGGSHGDAGGLRDDRAGARTLAHEAYRLLGLQSYFTAGPKEIRAWTIPVGATAPQAAGVIHTDFEKGFIRAEIYNFEDLMEHKTEAAIKAAGKMRSEGKTYVMQEGDIAHFLFNS